MPSPTRHEPDAAVDPGLLAGAVVDPSGAEAAHHADVVRRRRQRIVATAVAFALFVGLAALVAQVGLSDTNVAATAAAPKLAVTAESTGVLVLRPGHDPE